MPAEFQFDVFLSHSSKDKDAVRDIAERLRRDGLKVWFDEWEIKLGDSIPSKIEAGLENSRILLLCMSTNAFGSDWAQLEAGTFRFRDPLNKERRFIPLRLDDTPVRGSLAQFLYIKWLPPEREQEYSKLLAACRNPTTWSQTPNINADENQLLKHLAAIISARRKEWIRLRKSFEVEAEKYHDVKMSVFYVAQGKPTKTEKLNRPNHAINLWQFYGEGDESRERLTKAKFTKFGITGAEISAFGVISGKQTELFCKIAKRSGSLMPDKIAHFITDLVGKRFSDALGAKKPILVSNSNSLAKWLNLLLVTTTTCHPERFKDGELASDPFAASLTIFDYIRLDE